MKTIKIKIYEFSELSEEAKQKAISNLSDINVDDNWWRWTYEDAERIGLKITSFDLNRNRHCKGDFLINSLEVAQNILNEHGESCNTYKTAQNFLNCHAPIFADYLNRESENYESSELENKLQDLEEDFLNDILEDYSIILQDESEYLQSDEAIVQTIEANEYFFDINGNLTNY